MRECFPWRLCGYVYGVPVLLFLTLNGRLEYVEALLQPHF